MKKVFFAIAMLAAGIFSASAQDVATLSLGDEVTVYAGDTVTLEVSLTANFKADAFQLDINLPEGLAFATTVIDEDLGIVVPNVNQGAAAPSTLFTLSSELNNGGQTLSVISYLKIANAILKNTTTGSVLITVDVVTDGAQPGNYEVSLSDIVITNCETKTAKYSVRPTDAVTKTITIEEPTYYLAGDAAIMPIGTDGMPTSLEIDENGLTFTNIDHLLMGTYNYNVTVGNAEGATVYATGEPLVIDSNGMYTIVYTFDEAAKTITAVATRVADATSLGELDAATAEKLLIDGNVIIRRNGVDYTVIGQKL